MSVGGALMIVRKLAAGPAGQILFIEPLRYGNYSCVSAFLLTIVRRLTATDATHGAKIQITHIDIGRLSK